MHNILLAIMSGLIFVQLVYAGATATLIPVSYEQPFSQLFPGTPVIHLSIVGTVTNKNECPPCPAGAMCAACMETAGFNIKVESGDAPAGKIIHVTLQKTMPEIKVGQRYFMNIDKLSTGDNTNLISYAPK